ncbi:MAG: hypothetical protein GQ531_04735 [Sulfurovum sp.]|nr:hypothetical protein [Sulfurovum sp.]
MYFSDYLKSCREHVNLTQDELVSELYNHDIEHFEGLDANTISKWERAITHPKASKKVAVIKFFQTRTGFPLPCLPHTNAKEIESLICKSGVKNLTGNSKELILAFPSESMHIEDFTLYPLRDSERIDSLLSINMDIHKSVNPDYTQVSQEQFKAWALHPSNFFMLCEYKDALAGIFFTLRLKPEVFEKLMQFKMKKSEITTDDFASFEEEGCNFMLSFYALNQKIASLLFIRYYSHLIANQTNITQVGVLSGHDEVAKIVKNMNLKERAEYKTDEGETIYAYQANLANILASEAFVNMILTKQDCLEA